MPHWRDDPELAEAASRIEQAGVDLRLLAAVDDRNVGVAALEAFKAQLGPFENASFERALLLLASELPSPAPPVHPKVFQLVQEDFRGFAKNKKEQNPVLGSSNFIACAKLVTGRRFPAGPMDWEFSGIPRSWVKQAGMVGGAKFMAFVAGKLGGFKPLFFMHVALRPRNRSLVIEKEVMRAYYRMASSLRGWPEIKGIVAYGWFHDPGAVKDNPHLAFMNRPYLECGGALFRLEEATPESGFAENNAERLRQYEAGELRYFMYAAVWPREAALAWVDAHPEYDG